MPVLEIRTFSKHVQVLEMHQLYINTALYVNFFVDKYIIPDVLSTFTKL